MLDWLIIGGGVHGTHLSYHLTTIERVPRERLRVLDPNEAPLARWDACTANCGMAFLRSPGSHHLDVNPWALMQFANSRFPASSSFLAGYHRRPALALFRAHAQHVIERHRLAELRLRGHAVAVDDTSRGLRVETTQGAIEARRVIIAIGASEQPLWPAWARELRGGGNPVDHVYDPGFQRTALSSWSRLVVVGGGLGAVQTALALAREAPGTVTLLMRHGIREHEFDTDTAWTDGAHIDAFTWERDLEKRRQVIAAARHRGSVPREIRAELCRAIARDQLAIEIGEVDAADRMADGWIRLGIESDQRALFADRVVLATGFAPDRPGGAWLDRTIAELGLGCAACGYPLVDRSLRWHPGLYVSGALAELEIGPAARNIVGARLAAARISEAA
ncbi:MAG TPA: FAD-dependent oxidoreductase [Anaeromyxobacteraceae bacterium]|nr:FAD-dependent oxidoreductase [Anaeromyxobacteraceae bacterium]